MGGHPVGLAKQKKYLGVVCIFGGACVVESNPAVCLVCLWLLFLLFLLISFFLSFKIRG